MMNEKKPVADVRPYKPIEEQRKRLSVETRRESVQSASPQQIVGTVLDLKQAAALLQCHPKTLRLMAKAKEVPARRVGKLWRFSAHRLREWLDAN